MFRKRRPQFSITVARSVLTSIFDECDRHDVDETGGRIVGTYAMKKSHLDIRVMGVLGPGPKAKRSPTSFFQDGEYQEGLFRLIEQTHPDVEHLGNWHTHHVNGLQKLSGGDLQTYRATVNHHNHNTDFFYALLVTNRLADQSRRYEIKHYFFRRDDNEIYEVPHTQVRVVGSPAWWTGDNEKGHRTRHDAGDVHLGDGANVERAKDAELFSTFYPEMKSLFSQKVSSIYWKGLLRLIDGSRLEVLALETLDDDERYYSITASSTDQIIEGVLDQHRHRTYPSARHAVISLERDANRALFQAVSKGQPK